MGQWAKRSMPLIVVPDDAPPVLSGSAAYARLSRTDVRVYTTRPATPDDLAHRIREAEIVINIRSSSSFTREVLSRSRRLKLISIWGTGTDNVDLAAAKDLGIHVTNTPGVSAIAVAEHTLALLFAVAKQIVPVDQMVRRGEWPRAMVSELCGRTLGLIGLGAIGRQVARLGKGIGMKVVGWTFHPTPEMAEELGFLWVSFDDIFRQSDAVSVHLRQSPESTGLIHNAHFSLMRPTAFFINTARGAIVKEPDLIDALANGWIAGAGLDVFEVEPLPAHSRLRQLQNVVLTPHSAGVTPETTEAGLALAIENIFSFLRGKPRNLAV